MATPAAGAAAGTAAGAWGAPEVEAGKRVSMHVWLARGASAAQTDGGTWRRHGALVRWYCR
ncbi:hypothetical protein OAO87_04295 [bacterium]|nr:hypothetical protein [bacterium]